ncbi:MAG: sarcosine oxidase subunit delta [Gammaproteobacteria bacterium]|nr:sarcosine oxidase subunit delta [Gammaproteobacteria bacterium]
MKQFRCPILGLRPAQEFICAGSAIEGLLQADSAAARSGVYFGDATARVKREWWYHRPSQLWFLIERDTASDEVMAIELAQPVEDAHGA